ncbi:MAG: glycosyl transferase family 1 [Pseudomonadota bacterium]
MTHIAYFGHDSSDAAIRRRVRALEDDGLSVTGYMMRRGASKDVAWTNIDLGRTHDGAFFQRIRAVFSGADKAVSESGALKDADLILARNLDMLGCAFLAKRKAGLNTPVVYESLDIHRKLTASGPVSILLRALERSLLKRCAGLIVSSPGFLRNYFETRHKGLFTAYLVENRLAAGADYGARPEVETDLQQGKLRLGWFGKLRCQKSFDLLLAMADRFPGQVEIVLHGIPADTEIAVFEPEIEKRSNVRFGGRYKSPEDLARIYSEVDVVWAGDYMEAGYNSVWLLPNRLYEGGYYAVPSIAPRDTETASWIDAHTAGFTIPEPVETSLPSLIGQLLADPSPVVTARKALLATREGAFIQPKGTLRTIMDACLEGVPRP